MKKDVLQGYRLSPQQRHLWELLRRGRDESYQVKCAVTIKGPLKVRHLKTAAQNVVARHEILRTTFQCLPGMTVPIQVIEEGCGVIWKSEDISKQDDRALLIKARFHHPAQEFNFEQGPFLNIHLIKRAKHDHVMILRLPAICADAVSLRNMVGVLSRSYAAAVCGEALDGDVMQYVDLAEWQNELIEAEETRIGREYWHSQNLSTPAALQLAFEGRPAVEAAFEPGLDELEIAPPLTARLESLARSTKTSLDRILLACWYVLLWRHTGQPEIKVGAAFDGRRSSEIEDAVGLFAKYLPVTCHLEEELRFGALVEQLEQALLTVRGMQEYFSWEQFVEPSASAARTPFLPFCFEPETTLPTFLADGVSFTIFKHYACIDRFKIKLTYLCRSNGLVVEFHYDLELFRSADIRCLMGHFQALLENLTANPMAKIGELEMVTESERRQLLAGYNSTKTEWPQDQFVHELFLKQVGRTPEAVAVTYGNEQLTYREVNDRAARLAHYLCGLGVGPEVIAGVSMERSPDLIIALLAVLKAGGAYLPLDPSYPKERLAFMLGDAAIKLLLTQAHLRSRLPAAEQVVFVDAMWGMVLQIPALDCKTALSPDNLAYVVYTSGSTGKPKGVMLRHQSLKNYLMWAVSHYPVEAGCGAPVHTSLSFDLTITSLFTPLLAGGYVHLLPTENEIESLGTALSEGRGYGLVKLTPAHLQLLAEQLAGVNLNGAARSLVIGGENLPAPAVKWWRDRAAQTRLFNEYGPTESVVGCCVYEVGADLELEEARATVPIGRPIANTRLYILDERLQPTPQGIVGELCIGGEGLARGYLNLSSSTAERFEPDPYSGETGARLYRTGDLARYLRDGQIECLGRMDGQVKVRGYRIELGEVEAVLRGIPGVREAVAAVASEGGRNSLIGYVVGDEGRKPDVSRLLQYLHERLPEYMLPSALLALDALPLNENGKIDRKILPSLKEAGRQPGRAYVGPRNQVEEILAGIFEEVLRVEGVGVTDNFFEIGGHSLLATQVISRVRKTFGVEIGVKSIFKDATIEGLASRIEAAMRAGEKDEAPPLVRIDRESYGGGKFPPSFAQRRLWFIDNLDPGNVVYNMPGAVRLEGRLDLDALESVINEIVRRHEVLRTRFEVEDGEPVQVIEAWEPRRLEVTDLTRLTRETREEEVRRVAREEAWTGFDLSRGPLLRVKVLKLGEEEQVLFFTMHHIVSDGWSMGILIREVGELYQAYSRGETSPLAELPIQYADFAVWQRAYLAGEVLEGEVGYWKEQLKDAAATELPSDHARPAAPSYRGSSESVRLDRETSEGLRRLSQREGATLFMALMAAFKVLVMRYSGEEDVVVGTVIANRTRREVEGLIGFFVNTLVMRTDLSGNPSFRELMRREREVALGAYGRQDVPFEKLVEEINPKRGPSQNPLFQVLMTLQNTRPEGLNARGLKLSGIEEETGSAKFDLTLSLTEAGAGIVGSLEYSLDLYEGETIRRMARHYERVVEEVVREAGQRIREIEMMSESERAQILEKWNETRSAYPRERSIQEQFEEQVENGLERVAVVYGEEEVSYVELNRRANQLAHYLQRLGVGPEVRVGICVERGVEMIVGMLGILKAGGAYLPLDPAYPAERLRYMLEDGGPRVVITQERWSNRLPEYRGETVLLDRGCEQMAGQCEDNPATEVGGGNSAYVIYTSGSTGQPKGIYITHRAVSRLVINTDYVRLDTRSKVGQASNACFDAATFEIWGPLLSGGRVVGIRKEEALTVSELGEQLEAKEIDTLFVTTALFNEIARQAPEATGKLETLLFGGEAVEPRWVEKILEEGVPERLVHVYGPTESTTFATWQEVEKRERGRRNVPIGRPLANTELYLLDDLLEPAPVGVAGEIYLGGDGLARGYLGRAELTAERFVPHPFSESGERLYRTGDVGRQGDDGSVKYEGRVDWQVKLRGYRVEPEEVRAVLNEHRGVRQSIVVVREDEGRGKRLVGYAVVEGEVTARELKRHVREKLPEYMEPETIVILEEMPMTANGKIDRKRLPEERGERSREGGEEEEERTAVEEILAGIYEEVLRIEGVSVTDNFFEVGGHSLLATQVVTRAREVFGVKIGVRSIFEEATVKGLGRRIEEEIRRGKEEKAPPLVRVEGEGRGVLSFAQQRMWFLDRMTPNNPYYNMPGAVRLEGRLDHEVLERVINEIVRRHEVLRTRFEVEDGEPVQVIDAWEPRRLEVIDLTRLTRETREEEVRRVAREEAWTGFDLSRGPLLRVKVLKLGEEEQVLFFTMHHIVSDGWSMGVMTREVCRLYEAFSQGLPSPLPELDIQYGDYAVWQRKYLVGGVLEGEVGYWRDRLKGAAVMDLPTDHARPAALSYRGGMERVEIDREVSEGLKRLSQREGTTIFMALMAAFKVVLMKYSGAQDISVGTAIANRTRKEVENLIGFFVNTLVMRTDLSGNPSFRELMRREREVALGAYAHQEMPFEKLVEEINPDRDTSRSPLFQVMMLLQNTAREETEIRGLKLSGLGEETGTVKFDLTLILVEGREGIAGALCYSQDLYESGTINRMARHYERVVGEVVKDAEQRIREIELISEAEKRQIIEEWNETARNYGEMRLAHEIIAEEAGRWEEAIAVRSERGELSYGELNRRSSQLAHYLRRKEIGVESLVGICGDRSAEMVIAMLGVLKAGAAYVPIDAGYPEERVRYMLEDAGVRVLLTYGEMGKRWEDKNIIAEVIGLESRWEELVEESASSPNVGASEDNLAYVIYTSGSTGRPKGVMIQHQGLRNLVEAQKEAFGLGVQTRVLQFASLSFDASVWEIFSALATGGSLRLYAPERLIPGSGLMTALREDQITMVTLPPTALAVLGDEELINLQTVIAAGEACDAEIVERWARGRKFFDAYGPTEATVCASMGVCESGSSRKPSIGRPIANARLHILDDEMKPAPAGMQGELYIAGAGLARGYIGRPELTAERFIPDLFGHGDGKRLYRTGDVGRYLPDGSIDYIGRADAQVKVRGYRIELGEIEAVLNEHPGVTQSVVLACDDGTGGNRLVGYVVGDEEATAPGLKKYLRECLPAYMVPESILLLEEIPLLPNGKIDRRGLPDPERVRPLSDAVYAAPQTELEQVVAGVWQELLQVERVGIHDNFFDLGAHSMMMARAASKLQDLIQEELPVLTLFQYPTIGALAGHLSQRRADGAVLRQKDNRRRAVKPETDLRRSHDHSTAGSERASDIAVIGMDGRFPQAPTIDIFWRNLSSGLEAVSTLTDSQLIAAGVDPHLLADSRYVKAAASLDGVDLFDASFFGFSPREAEILDPQHRLFLQSAWHALESAGYVPDRFPGLIGLFAGAGFHSYLIAALRSNPEVINAVGAFQALISNDKDFLPTRVSYKLNLRGPSVAIQTGCSTSLVAAHMACQSLLNRECDIALAGGVSIEIPQSTGYFYQEGGIGSSDGHCRAFDAQASGTIGGSGLGLVVLKRLDEARADGDNILAVIKGSAINNDGSGKVGYTAPSIDGQARVIAKAQAAAGVDPATVTYVEAHGTATPLGDPIEVAALTQVFRAATNKSGFCAIGSVKTNIGHLDAAAGVAGLIKTVLALKHRQIPASLHFEQPNPKINFEGSPFYVNTELRPWETNGAPRRAGVSSFGIGGTNAHLILEEAPEVAPSEAIEGWQLLALSARSDRALTMMAMRLAAYLRQHPELNLADVAYTLQEGRKAFTHRMTIVCRGLSEAITRLEESGGGRHPYRAVAGERPTQVVYMFPGQGAQYVGMGRELYEQEPDYRSVIDHCAETVMNELGIDLRQALYPGSEEKAQAVELINQTRVTQVALFAVELGLARMWQSKGVQPEAMIGHSLGEYVAACLAGVMSDEQAVKLVARRGALMQRARPGAMLAVGLGESELIGLLSEAGSRLEVAAINGPQQCVVSGEEEEIAEFERRLSEAGIPGKRLKTSHAFHSRMMDEVVGEHEREVGEVNLKRPAIPYVSNVSGKWISATEAQEAGYWSRQMRSPVRYWDGLEQIQREIKDRVLLEVGPGETLGRLGHHLSGERRQGIVATLGSEAEGGTRALMEAVGKLWAHGVEIEWEKWRKGERRRVELPGYAFEEDRYWVEGTGARTSGRVVERKEALGDWFYVPAWKETSVVLPGVEAEGARRWLILEDDGGVGGRIGEGLERRGEVVTRVKRAACYERRAEREYWIRAREAGDYRAMLKELEERGELPEKILHLFSLSHGVDEKTPGWEERIEAAMETGFYSLAYLAQGLGQSAEAGEVEVIVVGNGVAEVVGEEEVRAEKALMLGPVKVMRQEYPRVKSRYIDVIIPPPGSWQEARLIDQLIGDLSAKSAEQVTAYRGNHRWVQAYEAAQLPPAPAGAGLRPAGVYMITGGLGQLGMMFAEYLAHSVKARLVLIGRRGLPERQEWERLMEQPDVDQELNRMISKLKALEEAGAEVEVIRADVSELQEMKEVVRRTRNRFGQINGVIHAAGLIGPQSIRSIQEMRPANSRMLFRAKVDGLFVLEEILRDLDLDFCFLFSSLSSVLGGIGFAAYSGSNIFMDAFAYGRNRVSPVPWISVNWDGWQLGQDDRQSDGLDSAVAEPFIKPQQGVEAFQRIISAKIAGQVIVSTGDLKSRIRQRMDFQSLADTRLRDRPALVSGYSRPELGIDYVAPRNDLERSIATIWQNLLGLNQIGIHDNFFDLGGHSLLAIQYLSRLRQVFQVEVPIHSLFEKPTVAGHGELIEEILLNEIEALTEEEASNLRREK